MCRSQPRRGRSPLSPWPSCRILVPLIKRLLASSLNGFGRIKQPLTERRLFCSDYALTNAVGPDVLAKAKAVLGDEITRHPKSDTAAP